MSDMTAPEPSYVADPPAPSAWSKRLELLDKWLAAAGDRMNPILVKETRQAIKSRQFTFTFLLLLIFCWIITIGGVALVGPGIYYSAAGGVLLRAYFWVLVFPLTVVVPFGAYRSLSEEREENTYDLLRVSTLSPHQIIRGKLGSAAVQMGVYLSAVAPCIAFTYLLRGVDVVTIAVMLVYSTLASLGLSMIGLLAAALANQKHGQVLLSVGFVTLLLGCFWAAAFLVYEFLSNSSNFVRDNEFWMFSGVLLTLFVTTFALVYLAAVALISYRSENRSTPLRWAMAVQQTAFVAWMAYLFIIGRYDDDVLIGAFLVAVGYWYVMGTLLSTEGAELSHRVRRSLPQSTMGRVVLGLFNPGPGAGYLFATANLVACAGLVAIAMAAAYYLPLPVRRNFHYEELGLVLIAACSYATIYLGLGKLVTAMVRRVAPVGTMAGFLIHALLLLAGTGIPCAIQFSSPSLRNAGYTILQWPNPFWTTVELANSRGWDSWLQAMGLSAVAMCVLLVNLPSIAREFAQGRVALPTRLVEDEAELHPPEPAKPRNPWEAEQVLGPESV